jgi:hypothetical protein
MRITAKLTLSLQKAEGFRVPGSGISTSLQQGVEGEAVILLLRTLDNAGSGVLRLSRLFRE